MCISFQTFSYDYMRECEFSKKEVMEEWIWEEMKLQISEFLLQKKVQYIYGHFLLFGFIRLRFYLKKPNIYFSRS